MNKKKTNRIFITIISLVLSFGFQNLAAQNKTAEKTIDELLTTAKASAIKTNFKLIFFEKNTGETHTSTGSFTLKGNKFILDMDNLKVWYNGKTQWAYSQSSNEVSITEPTEKELAETNPMAIIAGFRSKCNLRFAKKTSNTNYIVEMSPKSKSKDINQILVEINKSTGNLIRIVTKYNNGNTSTLTTNSFSKGISISDNIFIFNEKKYKGVVLNDLR